MTPPKPDDLPPPAPVPPMPSSRRAPEGRSRSSRRPHPGAPPDARDAVVPGTGPQGAGLPGDRRPPAPIPARPAPAGGWRKPGPQLETTTLWDFPSRHYGDAVQGDNEYKGATPAYVIWNLLQRYTREGDTVVDPMCGSGTTLDVCNDLGRTGVGFDLAPWRPDIRQADARRLPLPDASADFVFVDPPYSTHVKYSGLPDCIGELDAGGPDYYPAMEAVIAEIARVLRPKRFMALYVGDSYKKGKPFQPIGLELFARLRRHFRAQDHVCVTRRNRTLKRNHWHTAAVEGNYFLRGFNHLFIMKKES